MKVTWIIVLYINLLILTYYNICDLDGEAIEDLLWLKFGFHCGSFLCI